MADVDELARPKDTQKIVQRNAAMSATEQEDAEAPQGESVKLNSVKLPQEAMPVTKTSSQGGLREGRKPWSFKRSSERTEVSAASPSSQAAQAAQQVQRARRAQAPQSRDEGPSDGGCLGSAKLIKATRIQPMQSECQPQHGQALH